MMHMEKNVCDSIVGTLLNIKGKTKDGVKARQDLADTGIHSELHPQVVEKRTYLPPACHTLSKKKRKAFVSVYAMSKFHKGTPQILRV